MQKIKIKTIFGLIVICAFFAACSNSIMEKWWHEDTPARTPGRTPTTTPPEVGGVNFGVVFLDASGGLPQPEPFRVLWDSKVPRVRALAHTNTTLGFAGWYDEKGEKWDMDTRVVKPEDDIDGNGIVTITARWQQEYVTVKFVTNYEQLFGSDTSKHPKNQRGDIITVTDQKIVTGNKLVEPPVLPTDGIHGLIGWFTQDGAPITTATELAYININNRWDFEKNTVNDPVNTTITLYARWSTFSRTVHLQVNGGTRPNGQEITRVNFTVFTGLGGSPGGRIIDPGPLSREGHTFAGWYTDSGVEWNYSTSLIKEVDVLEGSILKSDAFILQAKWVPNIYLVSFKPDGGTPTPLSQSIVHGERIIRPAVMEHPPVASVEQAFAGWFIDPSNLNNPVSPTTEWIFDTDVVKSSITLTAKWEDKLYTVRFYLGNPPNGLFNTTIPVPQHVVSSRYVIEPFMASLPVGIDRYSFLRWDYHDTDDNPSNVNNETWRSGLSAWDFNNSVTRDMNLYARWVPPEPDMIWVPRGSFVMGDNSVSGSPATYHSYPTRRITVDGFYISRYEVTQVNSPDTMRGYQQVMGFNPSQFSRNTFRPVERVSWYDAIQYCIKLTSLNAGLTQVYTLGVMPEALQPALSGSAGAVTIINTSVNINWNANGFRLPTEAEWEYAARGGNNSPGNFVYAGSNDATAVAWFNITVTSPGGTQTAGSKQPNALGIYDMSGNVSEWVFDRFYPYKDITYNPRSEINISSYFAAGERVRRGGSWSNAISNVRSVVRNSDTPDTAHWAVGFRVVRGVGTVW